MRQSSVCIPWGGKMILTICLSMTVAGQLFAQTVTGSIRTEGKKPVAFATVLLLAARDSALVKGQVTSASGSFVFQNVATGSYMLQVSSAGLEDFYSAPFLLEKDFDAGTLIVKTSGVQLEKVVVTAKKPLFEQKIDRMIINVRGSITAAGGSALDVLERSPGILVNRQANSLMMNGKDGVVVMINGKLNRMPLSAVIQMLAGMSAANIEKIELITTPPANFDAEGNAGYINIVLINNPNQGFNGSYSVSAGWGRGERSPASFNFNYRHDKLNLYGDYSFLRNRMGQQARNFRRVEYQGETIENQTVSERDPVQRNHNARIGIDYQLSPKTITGLLVAAYDNKWEMDAENALVKTVNGQEDTSMRNYNHEINRWKHLMANLNLQHILAGDESLTFDLNYIWFKDDNPTHYFNRFYKPANNLLQTGETKSGKVTPIHIYVGSLDYVKRLNSKWKMQAGLKGVFSEFSNDIRIENLIQNVWVADPDFTDEYRLRENVFAAYTSVDVSASEKNSLSMGLRYEYTRSNLGTPLRKNIVDRKYGRLFPTVFFNRKIDDNESFNLSYARRITRPTFNELAPFVIFIDPNTLFSGNSILQPSIIDVIKAGYLYKNFLFALSYSMENGSIVRFQTDVDLASNKQVLSAQNLSYTRMLSGDISIPVTITGWWSAQNNLSVRWQEVKASYKGEALLQSKFTGYVNSAHSFRLPAGFSAEISGFYIAPSIFGSSLFRSFSQVNAGVLKKFARGGKLQVSVSDIFEAAQYRLKTVVPGQPFLATAYWRISQRVWLVTWTAPFGKKELKDKRARGTGAEEERKRVE